MAASPEQKALRWVIAIGLIAVVCMVFTTSISTGRSVKAEEKAVSLYHELEERISSLEQSRKWQLAYDDAIMQLLLDPSDTTLKKLKDLQNARRTHEPSAPSVKRLRDLLGR